jgi:hypothetical protein
MFSMKWWSRSDSRRRQGDRLGAGTSAVACSVAISRNISCGRRLKRWQSAEPIFRVVSGDYRALAAFARPQPAGAQFLIRCGAANVIAAAKLVDAHRALVRSALTLAIRKIVIRQFAIPLQLAGVVPAPARVFVRTAHCAYGLVCLAKKQRGLDGENVFGSATYRPDSNCP